MTHTFAELFRFFEFPLAILAQNLFDINMSREKGNGRSDNGTRENNHSPAKKFLFVSEAALITDLAWQIKKEGHEVRYSIKSKHDRDCGENLVEKVDGWEAHRDWADIVVLDDVGYGDLPLRLRKEGKAVIGGTAYTDRLELDRDFGLQEMKAAGLTTIPSWNFDAFPPAIDFVRKNADRYVVKPNGAAQNEKVLSFIGQEEDGLDVLAILEHYQQAWGSKIKSFQVQKFVSGVEVAVGGFFNGQDFLMPVCVNFEHKRMFNGEIGPTTGEMGTSMFWSGANRLYQETLEKMKARLSDTGYVGYFDINCIVNARGIFPLEMTPRFGYPTISIQMEGVLSKWAEILEAMATRKPFEIRTRKGFQLGVVIGVPPFPFDDPDAFQKYSEDASIIFKKPMVDGLHLGDVKLVDGDWRLAGRSGYALVITGSGTTMADAQREAYNRVKNVIIPNMFYRTDIGDRWAREGDLLQSWGYLNAVNT